MELSCYKNMEDLILNELSEVDIHFKLKSEKIYRKGKIVAYVPLTMDECLVGIKTYSFGSKAQDVEYYAFKEINVKRYLYEGDE